MAQTRRKAKKAYQCCQTCPALPEYPGATVCQQGYDLYYSRLSKRNKCGLCERELELKEREMQYHWLG